MLDTRMITRFDCTFEGAIDPDLSTFRAFPDAVAESEIDKNQTVVMFYRGHSL